MALGDLSVLEPDELLIAQVLLKGRLLTEEDMNRFLEYRHGRETAGKKFIGGVLIFLGYIKRADVDAYVKANRDTHISFLRTLTDEGYLTPEQCATVLKKTKETKSDIITIINGLNIMTRESYIRFFNNRTFIFRLGEWLVAQKKITQVQLDHAMKVQNINTLDDYLRFHNLVKPEILDKIKNKIAEAAN